MDWLSKLLGLKKIPTNFIILLWIFTGLLLYISPEVKKRFGLEEFYKDFGKYFGIVFLLSTATLIMLIITWIYQKINDKRLDIKYKSIIRDSIKNLDYHEKAVLREFYIQGKNTLKIPMDEPTVSGLISKRILLRVGNLGEMSIVGMLFSHSISKTARENLSNETLELPTGEPSDFEIRKIKESRPQWMIRLESKNNPFY
jgi:hypothetical protein